jgi:hypothetical protein
MNRPSESDIVGLLNYNAGLLEKQASELLRFVRISEERMLTITQVARRLQVQPGTVRKWRKVAPWKLPNFGVSALGSDSEYRCTISAFYDWYNVPGHPDAMVYHREQWDRMGAKERLGVRGIPA